MADETKDETKDETEVKVTLESREVLGLMGDMVAQLDTSIFVSDDPKTLLTSAAAFTALGALLESEAGAPSGTINGPSEMFARMFVEATRKGLEAEEAED